MRLVQWRIDKGLTQRQLADELGCSQPAVSLIERATERPNGNGIPTRDLMLKIYRVTAAPSRQTISMTCPRWTSFSFR
jgi:transcriptional regulator with XRE-family HTH domain